MHEDLGAGGRSPADVSTLLLELGRAGKGWAFYPPEHRARAELLDRAWRAWQGELRRGGPLELSIRRGAFWLPDAEAPLATRADDTARQLYLRSVRRVVFDAALDRSSFAAFLDVLTLDPDALAAAGGFEAAFYTGPRHGIQVNEADWRALLERHRVEAGPEDAAADLFDEAPAGSEDPPAAPSAADDDGASLETLLGLLDEAMPAAAAGDADAAIEPVDPAAARAHELESILSQLEECDDDLAYRDLARHLASLAESMDETGEREGVFSILVTLARHAGDDAKRSFAQRESAGGFLGQIAHGAALEQLIEHAIDATVASSLEATSALRQLGAQAAPALLDRLEGEREPERRGRLTGVLIAMGEETVPALVESLTHGSKQRMRASLRLAGEMQNPRLVECLREVLLSGESEIVRDAAQALVRVGDLSSLDVLTEALHSPRLEVAALAAYSLGATGRVIALAPLRDALARALAAGQLELAREIVRGLGRLGRAEAVPALTAVLESGGWFRRKARRDLELAATSALAHLPGADAENALARMARSRDPRLREAARTALRRRELEGIAARGSGHAAP